jgi:hypothetical protein
MSENVLLISDTMIKERTAIHGNIDPKLIYPDIKYAQDVYITPILGTSLDNKLKTLISGNTISGPTNIHYKQLIDDYLVDALIYYTLSELPTTISYQFWNKGVVRKQGENTELPTMAELMDIANKYKSRAEHYGQRMRLWIIQNAGSPNSWFPEYLNPGSTIDTITPEQRQFTMPIYLGDEGRDNPYCNRGGFNGQPYHD